jgi:CNT family concentrative nucleoside transporter
MDTFIDKITDPQRYVGLIGLVVILGIAFLVSNNRRKINYRVVVAGLGLQILAAILILKVPVVTQFFQTLGEGMGYIERAGKAGANFVYGGLAVGPSTGGPGADSTLAVATLAGNGYSNDKAVAEFNSFRKSIANLHNQQAAKDFLKLEKGAMDTLQKPSTPMSLKLAYLRPLTSDSAAMANAFGPEQAAAAAVLISHQHDFAEQASNYRAPYAFVFAFNITATIILVCVLVAILYHIGIMQRIVQAIAWLMNLVMRVSGAEALSNVASAFVGQVEAQVMIRPYLAGMTKSELLSSMSGSLACIAGGILVVYVSMGADAAYLLAASIMAAPGALVISKIVMPETEESQTMGKVKLEVKSQYTNIMDAIGHGASDGFKISMNVIALIIAFIALITLLNYGLEGLGHLIGMQQTLSLDWIFGKLFYPMAWAMGIPTADVANSATLLGQKLTINEFIAFDSMLTNKVAITTEKGRLITSIAICGFANFSSVGMQIGGIGALAPERRADLARLGLKALLCGTLASYMSATIAGILS